MSLKYEPSSEPLHISAIRLGTRMGRRTAPSTMLERPMFGKTSESGGVGRSLHINVQRSRCGLVFKAHRIMYHSTLGSRVVKKKKEGSVGVVRDFSCRGPRQVDSTSGRQAGSLCERTADALS